MIMDNQYAPLTFADKLIELLSDINAIRNQKIANLQVEYPAGSGIYYQADKDSQLDLKNAVSEIEKGHLPWVAPNDTWWDKDNVQRVHTITTLGEMSAAMTIAYSTIKRTARAVKDSCKGKTLAEIQAIVDQYRKS